MTIQKTRSVKRWALAGAAASVLASYSVAHAQENTRYEFDIEQKELGAALTDYGIATGNQVLFNDADVRGKTANELEGVYTSSEAVELLLDDTGVDYRIDDNGTLLVGNAYVRQANLSAPTEAEPFRLAQLDQEELPAGGRDADRPTGEPVAVTGAVKAFGSDANLKGAQVEILETGQRTATDDLGRFRFASVTPGDYTLRITYLGRDPIVDEITVDSAGFTETYAMGSEGTLDTIFVYGSRSARAQALNQERTAENSSTVIAADLLGDFTGSTISESLRRAPGVSFERDEQTGDGSNIIVRGLSPDLNAVKLNGVELPVGSGTGRSADLGNILTDSISKITINKTLLPSQDSAGTGGLIEIETKSPLDRGRRFASFTLEGGTRDNDFNDEFSVAGTVSGTFGDRDQFGLSGSVQYRDREIKRIAYFNSLQFGEYLPLQVDGTPTITDISQIDPRTPFPFETGADGVYVNRVTNDVNVVETSNLALTLSAAWDVAEHTNLRFDFNRSEQDDAIFRRRTDLSARTRYALQPVVALGGEERRALEWRDTLTNSNTYRFIPSDKSTTDVFSFKGDTDIGKWEFNYLAGYTQGTEEIDDNYFLSFNVDAVIDPSFVTNEAIDPVEGRILSPFPRINPGDDSYPLPLITQEGFDLLNDPASYGFRNLSARSSRGENERYNFDFSVKYNFDHEHLKYLQAGVAYERSEFSDFSLDNFRLGVNSGVFPSLASLGVGFDEAGLADIGLSNSFRVISQGDLERFVLQGLVNSPNVVDASDPSAGDPGVISREDTSDLNDPRSLEEFTLEEEFAAFVQARLEFGKLEVIGGARVSQYEIEAFNASSPFIINEFFVPDFAFAQANQTFARETASQTDVLPRVQVNYRQSDNLIFRGGYYLSIARPQISNISRTPGTTLFLPTFFGPNNNQSALFVTKGNADLEPTKTDNFDIGVEFYDDNIGVIKLSGFYKRFDNLLEATVTSGEGALEDVVGIFPDDPRFDDVVKNPDDYFISVTLPFNNESTAESWGIEANIERQFTFLPGLWNGFGVFTNYTYTDSSKEQPIDWSSRPILDGDGNVAGFEQAQFIISDVRFNGQPEHSGTFGITYNKYGIDANIAYTAQARRQTSFEANNLSAFEEAFDTLDLRAEYRFDRGPGNYRVFFEALDILRGPEDAGLTTTIGADDNSTPKYFNSGSYFGGRQFRLGLTATF